MLRQYHLVHKNLAFTLVELITVVALIAIIATIAVPSYLKQVRKANRAEAKTALLTGSQAMERCFTSFTTYSNAGCPTDTSLSALGQDFFTYSITATPTTYNLLATANPSKGQDKDTNCKTFSINNIGLKSATDSSNNPATDCW